MHEQHTSEIVTGKNIAKYYVEINKNIVFMGNLDSQI